MRKDDESDISNDETCIQDAQPVKKNRVNEIVSSLLLSEGVDVVDQDEFREEESVQFESVPRKKTRSMTEFNQDAQDFYGEIDDSECKRRKRPRFKVAASFNHRRSWVKTRSKEWWDDCNRPDYSEQDFRKAFRMGKDTFEMICEELNSHVAKEDTSLRNAIPVRQRVAICIWRLATGEPLRLVSKRFGLGISTCHKLVLDVCVAISTVLMTRYLKWPDKESLKKVKNVFESVSGIPNVVGSMYTTHVPITAPKVGFASYLNKRHTESNQKTSYSITVQGVVDHRGIFTDVCIGWPGSMPDDQVLGKSALFQRANEGQLKGTWVVGGSGYPLMDWTLVPYSQQNLTWTQHAFNEKIGKIQALAKDAFRKLKSRWGCLQKPTQVKLQELPVVLGACCVLHNICEIRKEEFDPELRIKLVDDEMVPDVPLRSKISVKARNAIAHNLLHHGFAGYSFL